MADFDFSQFFNPSAWGSWAPGGIQGLLSPGVQNAPTAPSPAGAAPPPAAAPAAPPAANPASMPNPLSVISSLFNKSQGGTGLPGATGVGASNSQNNNLMSMGLKMLQPQMGAPPQIQMARPVGPGQMQAIAAPFGTQPGFGMQTASNPQRQLGMLGNYGF